MTGRNTRCQDNRAQGLVSKICCLMLLGSVVSYGTDLLAQARPASSAGASATSNEQQTAGRRLFMQNCSFCHLPKGRSPKSTAEGTAIGPLLKGIFQGDKALSEQTVRTFIMRGIPQKMPGFQYGLEPKEIDAIITYLKSL